MKIKNTQIVLLALSILFFQSCNSKDAKELSDLRDTINIILLDKYNDVKKIEGINITFGEDRMDSIYIIGNRIIEMIDKRECYSDCEKFVNKYGDGKFEIKNWNNKEYLKSKIQLIQLYAIDKEIEYFVTSHFQVDMIGLIPSTRSIYRNRNEVIEIVPFYVSSEIKDCPIIVINSDTLEKIENSYIYNAFYEHPGDYFIETEVTIKRWNETLKLSPRFVISVK